MRASMMEERLDWDRRDANLIERQTNVTLICDPTAGLGFPQVRKTTKIKISKNNSVKFDDVLGTSCGH